MNTLPASSPVLMLLPDAGGAACATPAQLTALLEIRRRAAELSTLVEGFLTQYRTGFAPRARPINPEAIVAITAGFFNLPEPALRSRLRTASVAWARHVAMYLCRQFTRQSQHETGAFFSRDHSSVVHAERMVAFRIKTYPTDAEAVKFLSNRIEEAIATERKLLEA